MFKVTKSLISKIVLLITLGIFLLLVALVILIRTPWGQNSITNKATSYISKKTNTKVAIDKLYLTFSGNLLLEGLYLEDTQKDTLVYSKKIEASVALLPLIKGTEFHLKTLNWEGLKANVSRDETSEKFNFNFLIEAFQSEPKAVQAKETRPLKITIGQIDLNTFDLNYNDNFLGLKDQLKFESLAVNFKTINVEKMFFEVNKFHFSKAKISHFQTKPFTEKSTDTSAVSIPKLNIKELQFDAIDLKYVSIPDAINAKISLGALMLNNLITDVDAKNISALKIGLEDSQVDLKIKKQAVAVDENTQSTVVDFIWPDWEVAIKEISLKNNQLQFKNKEVKEIKNVFNPALIALKDFNLKLKDLAYKKGQARAALEVFSFKERSGFTLKKANFVAAINNNKFYLLGVDISTLNTSITGAVKLKYPSVNKAINSVEEIVVDMDIPTLELSPADVFYFNPSVRNNEVIKALQNKKIYSKIKVNGYLDKLTISKFNARWDNTQVSLSGTLRNALESDKLSCDLKNIVIKSNKNNIENFIPKQQLQTVAVPEGMEINGAISGSLKALKTDLKLLTTAGDVTVNGVLNITESYGFNGLLNVQDLRLNKLIRNQQLGALSLQTKINLKGTDLNTLTGDFSSDFSKLELNGYSYEDLTINGLIDNGKGVVNSTIKDVNLNASLQSNIDFDAINYKLDVLLDITGADLYALKLSDKKIKTKLKLKTNFNGNLEKFESALAVNDIVFVIENDTYNLSDLLANASVNEGASKAIIKGSFINATLNSNSTPSELFPKLQQYFESSISIKESDSIEMPNNKTVFKLDAIINEAPILNEVLFPELSFSNIALKAEYNESNNVFNANLFTPSLKYKNNSVEAVSFSLDGNDQGLKFDFNVANLDAGTVKIKSTSVVGEVIDKKLRLNFNTSNGLEKIIQIESEISQNLETYVFSILPGSLLFNSKEWQIPSTNNAVFSKNKLVFNDFDLTRNTQALTFSSSNNSNDKDQLNLIFDNFKLSTFTSFLNVEETIATGVVHGNLTVEDPFNKLGIIADLTIDKLGVKNQLLGDLKFTGQPLALDAYALELGLNGADINLDINGNYKSNAASSNLNFDIDLKKINLNLVERFFSEQVSETTGTVFGKVKLGGTMSQPSLEGDLNLKEVGFNIKSLNTVFKIPKESVQLNAPDIYFNRFTIYDKAKNTFELDGKIGLSDVNNPTFDLALKAKKIQVLNASQKDNPLFYGNVNLNVDMQIGGDLNIPEITGNLAVNKDSDFTYVIPEAELELVEKEGVVVFVNKENPNAIITRKEEESNSYTLKGFDIQSILKVDKDAVLNIIVDERTGDKLQISGAGDFNLGVNPNGNTSITGKYLVESGFYEVNLYNLVQKRFDLAKGSSVTWKGDPLDAEMKIRAIYKVETSAAGLMATKTSASSIESANRFSQKTPFLVYLNLNGGLLTPEISFNIDIPKDKQGDYGGAVYTQLQQLNTQEEELNKQVFSLLVLNQFFPKATSDGSRGGSAKIARDNVNNVLSDQLNNFSSKYTEKTGLDLNFDLNSFEGASGKSQTNLDISAQKKLLNDRLTISVGSEVDIQGRSQVQGQNNAVVGNVSLEYLLTENGRYIIKGFRKNQFESVIDGQVIVTGIAFIFNREFNQFKELWKKSTKVKKGNSKKYLKVDENEK